MQIVVETRLFELSIISLGGILSPHSEDINTVVMRPEEESNFKGH
jgi:hypothetical protein